VHAALDPFDRERTIDSDAALSFVSTLLLTATEPRESGGANDMKFKAFIENGAKEFEVEFEIDDEAAAHARLTEAIAKIQKLGKKPERTATKPVETARTGATTPAATGGAK
jgi:predicted deacetylase